MRHSITNFRKCVALAGSAVLAAGAGTAILGDESTVPLQIAAVTVDGSLIQVSVRNVSSETLSGTVHVRALLEDGVMGAATSVTLAGGQSTLVEFETPAPVQDVECGVVLDDGSPF